MTVPYDEVNPMLEKAIVKLKDMTIEDIRSKPSDVVIKMLNKLAASEEIEDADIENINEIRHTFFYCYSHSISDLQKVISDQVEEHLYFYDACYSYYAYIILLSIRQ